MLEALLGHGEADQAASVLGHEIDCFRSDLLSGKGQVTFVLAVLVIDDHDHASRADFLNGVRNVREWQLRAHCGDFSRGDEA